MSNSHKKKLVVTPKEFQVPKGQSVFEFVNFYTQYARFHSDETNTWIHIVFVPIIALTLFGIILNSRIDRYFVDVSKGFSLQIIDSDDYLSTSDPNLVHLSVFWILWSILGCIYVWCDTLIGFMTFCLGVCLYKIALQVQQLNSQPDSVLYGRVFQVMAIIHVIGWFTQFAGHGIYERRAPALLTNLFFLFIAPFFVVVEVANIMFGLKQEEIDKATPAVEADIAFYRLSKGYPMREGISIKKSE